MSAACEICGSSDDLRIAPLMTGGKFGQPAKHPVCSPCLYAWYESGETTPEEILAWRRKYESSMLRLVDLYRSARFLNDR